MQRKQLLDIYFGSVVRLAGFDPEGGRYYLARLFDGVPLEGRRVLDIGGGRGVYSYYAGCMGAEEVTCLEPQGAGSLDDMIASFRSAGEQLSGLTSVHLEIDTIQNWDPGDRRFDVVLMHASINHLDEDACSRLHRDDDARSTYRAIFDKIAAMCTPGANLIAVDCSRHNFFGMLGRRSPFSPAIDWDKHQPPSRWAEQLRRSGFENPRVSWGNHRRRNALFRALLNNRVASFFLGSYFCLKMTRAR
jgi:hypothetical protein